MGFDFQAVVGGGLGDCINLPRRMKGSFSAQSQFVLSLAPMEWRSCRQGDCSQKPHNRQQS
jgi:hypothetical protein